MKLVHRQKQANSLNVSQQLPQVEENGASILNIEKLHFCFSLNMPPKLQALSDTGKDRLGPLDGRQYFSVHFNGLYF